MTDKKTSFASPETDTNNVAVQLGAVQIDLGTPRTNGTHPFFVEEVGEAALFVVKTPRANSKLILQNMEEVLNSVKKKHRQKHRRKKEQKKLAQIEAEAAAGTTTATTATTNASAIVVSMDRNRKSEKKRHKKPLQDKAPHENGLNHAKADKPKNNISPLKSAATKTSSILNHFSRTPKKGLNDEAVELNSATKTTNAFEVMMSARNKSIGSNTPGKEVVPNEEEAKATTTLSVKRKLILQEWADKKGGLKRKVEEETRAAYVERKLEQRAKRFKKMLTSCANSTDDDDVVKHKENSSQKTVQNSCPTEKIEEKSAKKPRGRPRKIRVFSVDTLEAKSNTIPDVETAEFLAKLNSPTKKRDSLLGYFPKKNSPQQSSNQVDSTQSLSTVEILPKNDSKETPKRKQRSSTAKHVLSTEIKDIGLDSPTSLEVVVGLVKEETESTPNGRPKRSCAGKARYDYDLEDVLINSNEPQEFEQNCEREDELVIVLDDSITSHSETPKKLAPLFVRAMPKPSPDPVALKAREEFLRSGVPEGLRLEQIKQKEFKLSYEENLELFPQISHVQQFSVSEEQFSKQSVSIKCKLNADSDKISPAHGRRTSKQNKVRYSLLDSHSFKAARAAVKSKGNVRLRTPITAIENKRDIIKGWKTEFDRFPTYKCYNQLREKYRFFSAIDSAQDTEQVGESLVVTRRTFNSITSQQRFDPKAAEEKPPLTAPNGELLFSEKYKPMLFEQVLVNLTPVTQLRDFLANWSCPSSARNSQTILEDSIDFSGNDSNMCQQGVCNSVVLLGPGSSGKTSAVFALANEMNFNVIEINAGMKRTGKRLLQELQEATQSHQIRKDSTALPKILKKSLKRNKSIKAHSTDMVNVSSSSPTELSQSQSQSTRKCLILIEDADIVFEQSDAGFTDAIYTLAASSKRPVIVVATNPNCSHLQRLIHQNVINFTAPNVLNITKFLSVLSLIENCPINLEDLISLYLYNRKDLRKTLQELQFFIQSGGDRHRVIEMSSQHLKESRKFFASSNKTRFADDSQAMPTTKLNKKLESEQVASKDLVYMHRTLFEYYTLNNERHRIPFPVDFRLLCINLNELLQVSSKLKTTADATTNCMPIKRKSRSPKKAWLSSAITNAKVCKITPLDSLCDFYENISIATLLGNGGTPADSFNSHCTDRLMPHLGECIAHELVEQAIGLNLDADLCAYNLFDTPMECNFLSDNLSGVVLRSSRARCLDYEPALRAICRNEHERGLRERRSTRFYHYLRNCSVNICNFSTAPFDAACCILQSQPSENNEVDEIGTEAALSETSTIVQT